MSERVLADRYRIEEKLGEGGMAEVFLVHDPLADRPLALKLLKAGASGRDYFMQEFRVLSRLDHPNLVRVHDFGVVPGDGDEPLCYYTCEYLAGSNLFEATQGMDFDGLFDVVRQVLEALAYIHDRGLVHYDIKPENIYVEVIPPKSPGRRPDHLVKLVDFGLTGEATTRRGEKIKGTIHYVAPEVARSLPADRRADLYSLGITLYYCVTRKLPYDGGSAVSILRKHLETAPEPPASVRTDVPEAWASFILRLIEKDPALRFADAPEALADLARRLGKPYEPQDRDRTRGVALSPSFVGRERELEQLISAFPGGASGGPCVFWIEGEEGVGKTRLVHSLKVHAQLEGVPFLDSVCLKEGEQPFARIVRLALTLPGVQAEESGEALETLFPGCTGGAYPRAQIQDPGDLRVLLDRTADFLLRAARGRPYVLVLEDVRRANEITVALLGVVLRNFASRTSQQPRPLVILTDRPEGESGEVLALTEDIPEEIAGEIVEDLSDLRRQLSRQGAVVSLPLGRLSAAGTRAMLGSMLALESPPGAVADRIHEVTSGNPFFVEELVRSLVEDGVLEPRRGDLPTSPEVIEAPRSLAELLGRRLARMPEDTRAVLIALAVLVAPSPLELLAQTAKRSPESTLDALDVLLRRLMVARDRPENGPVRYRLAHSQVQRSVLKSVSRRALEATHRRAQAALEQAYPESSRDERVLERLARHANKAGDLGAALDYSSAAGVAAQRAGNPTQAIDLLDRALELVRWEDVITDQAGRRQREALLLTRLSEVLSTVGRYKASARALEELLGIGDDALGSSAAVWARRRLGDLALRRGSAAEARRWLQDALEAAGDSSDGDILAERARVLEVMARIALWRGDYLAVIALATETVEIFTGIGREADTLWARNILCTSEYFRAHNQRAAEHLAECLRLVRGDAASFVPALRRLSLGEEHIPRLDAALSSWAPHAPLRREAGDSCGLVLSFTQLGTYFDMCAEQALAVEFYEASLEAYQRMGDAQKTALAHNNLGVFSRHRGQMAQALEEFESALAILEGTGDRQGGAVALMNLVLLLLVLGDGEGAQSRCRRALTIAREVGLTWLTGHCHRVMGRVLAMQGALSDAERELQRAAGVFRMIGNRRSLGDLLLDRAEVLCEAGHDDRAREMLSKAMAAGEEVKAADFLTRQRALEGRLAMPDAAKAVDAFEEALRQAERSGMEESKLEVHRGLAQAHTQLGTLRLAQKHLNASHDLEARLLAGVDPRSREAFELSQSSAQARETSRRLVERSLED